MDKACSGHAGGMPGREFDTGFFFSVQYLHVIGGVHGESVGFSF